MAELCKIMEEVRKWFALYTKPRWEKKIDSTLLRKGINSWCPLQKIEKKWSDRKKIVEEPLFRSYVFVNINDSERLSVLQTEGVLNFIHYLGKPAVIRDEEIELIRAYLLEQNTIISIEPLQGFRENDKVTIKQGVFMDNTGTVIRPGNKKVYVKLESLGQLMVVEFPLAFIAKSN